MKLSSHSYGKSRVRVMKILRDGATHTVKELDVAIALTGDFETSYTSGDNHLVVATDTMKNTVNVLAQRELGAETERFGSMLARHFTKEYPQVQSATVQTSERVWDRMTVSGVPHPHSFLHAQGARPTVTAIAASDVVSMQSGVTDLLILKSTGSGFVGYPRCEFTTLPETTDRIFATSVAARWDWIAAPTDYNVANRTIIAALLEPFAQNYSPSVQTTLFEMGQSALRACPEISCIHLSLPNKHCLPIDLRPFGDERRDVFLPTDEPHGLIEATVARE